jgi:hypothetical protein
VVDGALIVCEDGTETFISDGNDGEDGVLSITDPCGDDPNHPDEVLLSLNDGSVIVWYKNVGLSVLTVGNYTTTDHQKCNFTINEDGVISW